MNIFLFSVILTVCMVATLTYTNDKKGEKPELIPVFALETGAHPGFRAQPFHSCYLQPATYNLQDPNGTIL